MSQDFKFNLFDENKSSSNKENVTDFYQQSSSVRNVCFEWLDGRMKFLNYAYLVSGEYAADSGNIVLAFTTESVEIHGLNLKPLFNDLMNHMARIIKCSDARYNDTTEENDVVINKILLIEN